MIDGYVFRGHFVTDFPEWLLSELTHKPKKEALELLEEETWNEVRVQDYRDGVSPNTVYANKLIDALIEAISQALGEGVDISVSVDNLWSYIEINGVEIAGEKDWTKFLHNYGRYRQLSALVNQIRKIEGDGAVLNDIKTLKPTELMHKYRVTDNELDTMGFGVDAKFMPASIKKAVYMGRVIKTYVEENLSDDYEGCRVDIEYDNVAVRLVLRGECGSNPVATLSDVTKLTK